MSQTIALGPTVLGLVKLCFSKHELKQSSHIIKSVSSRLTHHVIVQKLSLITDNCLFSPLIHRQGMTSFPTVQDLANASDDEVNAHWAGLGFYRRAKLLHKGAKYVVDDLGGVIPQTVDELMTISGIGR